MRCPCGTGLPCAACCGPWLAGASAPTAGQVMRSRYTAFARHDREHLLRTWHPSTRPTDLVLDEGLEWAGLEVLRETGGLLAIEAVVEFRAHSRHSGQPAVLHERSRFVREAGAWLYVAALPPAPGAGTSRTA